MEKGWLRDNGQRDRVEGLGAAKERAEVEGPLRPILSRQEGLGTWAGSEQQIPGYRSKEVSLREGQGRAGRGLATGSPELLFMMGRLCLSVARPVHKRGCNVPVVGASKPGRVGGAGAWPGPEQEGPAGKLGQSRGFPWGPSHVVLRTPRSPGLTVTPSRGVCNPRQQWNEDVVLAQRAFLNACG